LELKALKEDKLLVENMFDYNNKIFIKVVFRAIMTNTYLKTGGAKIVIPFTHNLITEENIDISRD
jgi:hypothetical protein